MCSTVSSHPPVQVPLGGGGDEIVTLSWFELHPTRGRRKVPKSDGNILEALRFITDRYNLRSLAGDSATLELLLTDTVDHVLLLAVLRTHQVELVILPGKVTLVHIDDIVRIVQTKDGVC